MATQDIAAFPMPSVPHAHDYQAGMTLRDYFAGQALISLVVELHEPPDDSEPDWALTTAKNAYALADAMLAERESRSPR